MDETTEKTGRSMQEVSADIKKAGIDAEREDQVPTPQRKTPEEMAENPENATADVDPAVVESMKAQALPGKLPPDWRFEMAVGKVGSVSILKGTSGYIWYDDASDKTDGKVYATEDDAKGSIPSSIGGGQQ